MTKSEFQQFYRYISSVTTDTNPSPEKTQVYWDTLNDLPFDVAMIAAKKVISTLENPFLPMPAVFRGVAAQLTKPKVLTAGEAYEQVLRAINNFGGQRGKEALESLPALTRQAVNAVSWYSLCYSEKPDVVRSQFTKAYEALEKRENIESKVPESLKQLAIGLEEKFMIESKTGTA